MDWKELQGKSNEEFEKILASSRNRLRELRFKIASRGVKNVREIRVIRKTIARILTLRRKQKDPSS